MSDIFTTIATTLAKQGADWDGDGSSTDQRRHDGMHLQATQPIR